MQAIKEKLHDLGEMRKAKAEAKAEEKAQKDMAKARVDIAHEVRMAREAEAEMDMHVSKAKELADKYGSEQSPQHHSPNATNSPPTF
ncbi:hypothetical protein DITRI_Ditri20bG0108700 [Diplodiscus trichospermus]